MSRISRLDRSEVTLKSRPSTTKLCTARQRANMFRVMAHSRNLRYHAAILALCSIRNGFYPAQELIIVRTSQVNVTPTVCQHTILAATSAGATPACPPGDWPSAKTFPRGKGCLRWRRPSPAMPRGKRRTVRRAALLLLRRRDLELLCHRLFNYFNRFNTAPNERQARRRRLRDPTESAHATPDSLAPE